MRRIAVGSILLLAFGSIAVADEVSHREAAFRLLEVSQARNMLDRMLESLDSVIGQQFDSLDLPAEARAEVEQRRAKMMDWLAQVVDWEEMSQFLVTVYVEAFTEAEIEQLADFYESSLGQKLIERMPLLTQRSAEWAALRVQQLMPELKRRVEATTAELRRQYGGDS